MKRIIFAAVLVFIFGACGQNIRYDIVEESEPSAISFEVGYYGFYARGGGEIQRTREAAHTGNYSLVVTGRNASWNGILFNTTEIAQPFGEYEFSLWVKHLEEIPVTFQLSAEFVQVTGADGTSGRWRHFSGPLANVTVPPNEWTFMQGVAHFEDFITSSVYIETDEAGAWAEFFIDDVIFRCIAVEYEFDNTLPRLFEIYADYFIFGTAIAPRDLRGTRAEFIAHHFNAITAGNDMKPDALQPQAGVFNWHVADYIAQFAEINEMHTIGHTLVWHMQSPAWMNPPGISREQAIENLERHITEVVSRYAGRILVWDVVNEAFPSYVSASANHADWRGLLRQTPWSDAIGYDFIEIAFRAAHAADPSAKLIYNDYNLDGVGKREAVFHMIKELRERGVPIHGVGMQGHYNLRTNPQRVENSILRFAELGIPVSITELDITVQSALGYSVMPDEYELAQAILYAELFTIFREHHEHIHRVTLWGVCDATSWHADRFPLPFNRNLSAKQAFFAIADPHGFLEQQG
ncbi:MAG: endo-1,4-beta-xylanase [Defluviitaleaceae bacterium]|nr:endo-1,4-beta-xylanase [Defluviitaleaceae bacterium]MCL2262908.1 endo-1,4-beta-xylanase [Defluviitaleaceae bacterium]